MYDSTLPDKATDALLLFQMGEDMKYRAYLTNQMINLIQLLA